ncbi:hypothetical protein DMUE_3320 [Dictyocoela muelleri]|nr:hypothetical protein DMUE_3320 [Dictyocoela muelleri]
MNVKNNISILSYTPHISCASLNFGKYESLYHRNEIKRRSLNTRRSTRDVVNKILQNISPITIPYISKYKTLIIFFRVCEEQIKYKNPNDDIPEIIKKLTNVKISTCSILVGKSQIE